MSPVDNDNDVEAEEDAEAIEEARILMSESIHGFQQLYAALQRSGPDVEPCTLDQAKLGKLGLLIVHTFENATAARATCGDYEMKLPEDTKGPLIERVARLLAVLKSMKKPHTKVEMVQSWFGLPLAGEKASAFAAIINNTREMETQLTDITHP